MEVTFRLEVFEGPLDLLLHLISVNKVSIDDIPIAEILAQYIEYLERLRSLEIEVTSAFVVMAAQLIYIKSKLLLPRAEEEEEDPRMSLAQRLAEYKLFKEAAGALRLLEERGRDLISKYPEPQQSAEEYRYGHDAAELAAALSGLTGREKKTEPAPYGMFSGIVGNTNVSVEEQAERLLEALKKLGGMGLKEIFSGVCDRVTAVAAFLAVLDLCRTNRAFLNGEDVLVPAPEQEILL